MSAHFAIVPVEELHEHEQTDRRRVRAVAEEIRRSGSVDIPILVDRLSGVILDGHHRFQALLGLGARRVPAWNDDYKAENVRLERWRDSPPNDNKEVVERARAGQLYPPKTTRHSLELTLPPRRTALAELIGAVHAAAGERPAHSSARRRAPAGPAAR